MTRYAFIGDIHSHNKNLNLLLEEIYRRGEYKLVFLGDIFDYAATDKSFSDPRGVLNTLKQLRDSVVLNSNHQDKLLRYLRGTASHVKNPSTLDTINRLGLLNIETDHCQELKQWLSEKPHYLIVNANGEEYRLAHAYHSSRIATAEKFNHGMKQSCLYGPILTEKDEKGNDIIRRLSWWLEPRNFNFVRVAGHYHTVYVSPQSLILDGGCGASDDGFLAAYLTDTKEIISTAPCFVKKPITDRAYYYMSTKRPLPQLIQPPISFTPDYSKSVQ
jgi:hypothetical protein